MGFSARVDARSQTAYNKFSLSIFAFRKCDIAHPNGSLGLHATLIFPSFYETKYFQCNKLLCWYIHLIIARHRHLSCHILEHSRAPTQTLPHSHFADRFCWAKHICFCMKTGSLSLQLCSIKTKHCCSNNSYIGTLRGTFWWSFDLPCNCMFHSVRLGFPFLVFLGAPFLFHRILLKLVEV